MSSSFDVCVRGAGIVGRALALKLGHARLRVALVDEAAAGDSGHVPDIRAYALNRASRQLLLELRCWPSGSATTPVGQMLVYGDDGGALRFDAPAGHVQTRRAVMPFPSPDPLAWIVDVPALENLLGDALRFQATVEVVDKPVNAPLTAICEGRHSHSREQLGIEFETRAYPQHAIATRVRSNRPHGGVACQWFSGPHILALLPLGGEQGDSYAVVWSTGTDEADRLMALDDAGFAGQMQTLVHNVGPGYQPFAGAAMPDMHDLQFELLGARARWPLRLSRALQWTGSMPGQPQAAWALLGDAAHTVHPLAGSGLNLGLGDVISLSGQLQQRPAWRAVSDRRLLRNYERERKSALLPFAVATDGMQWLFWQEHAWLQALRNLGLRGFSASGPLKRWVMHRAMGR